MNNLVGLNQPAKYREVAGTESSLQGLETYIKEHLLLSSMSDGDV